MRLRNKVVLWLAPVILPVLAINIIQYHAQIKALENNILGISSLVVENGSKEINDYLRLRTESFHLLANNIDGCTYNAHELKSEQKTQIGLILNNNPGFSLLAFTDLNTDVIYSTNASNEEMRHFLPRSVRKTPAFTKETFQAVRNNYETWKAQIPVIKSEVALLNHDLQKLTEMGEITSERHRALQEQILLLESHISDMPHTITFGGRALAEKAGMPFRTDTFMFITATEDCSKKQNGYLFAMLDWTLIEDMIDRMRSRIEDRGMAKSRVFLYDAAGQRTLSDNDGAQNIIPSEVLNQVLSGKENIKRIKSIGYIAYSRIADPKVLQGNHFYSNSENTANRYHYAYDAAVQQDSAFYLVGFVPEEDIAGPSRELLIYMLGWVGVIVLLLSLLIFMLARKLTGPIIHLTEAMKKLTSGKIESRVEVESKDEIGFLASTFNTMADSLQEKQRRLEHLNMIDGLTGVANRRCFDKVLEREFRLAVRKINNLSLILIDVDFFKLFNDNYGHVAGDKCLIRIARKLDNFLTRPTDLVARYGGEEFIVILPDTDKRGALSVAEKLRESVESLKMPHAYSDAGSYVTISLGVMSGIPTSDIKPESFVRAADEALYKAKNGGRNRVFSE